MARNSRSRALYSISSGPGDTDSESGFGDEKLIARGGNSIDPVVVAPAPTAMLDEKVSQVLTYSILRDNLNFTVISLAFQGQSQERYGA